MTGNFWQELQSVNQISTYFMRDGTYDYSRALTRDEAFVCLIDKLNLYGDLAHCIKEASLQYGFTFEEGVAGLDSYQTDQFLVRHAIILDGIDNPQVTTEKYQALLSKCTSATLAISYSSEKTFNNAEQQINRLKIKYGPTLNYLRPTLYSGLYIPTKQKLVDNSICDSVRVKYKPHKVGNLSPSDIPSDVRQYFCRVSKLIHCEKLYHRSATDGFISLRHKDGGFYITCTKTSKIDLDLHRVALVHEYDRNLNQISYSGSFLPSSDCVEAATLYSKLPWLGAIVHTHASIQFTRNPKYRHKVAAPPSRYGEPALGDQIAAFIDRTKTSDFIIMEDHGELFLSSCDTACNGYVEISNRIRNELQGYSPGRYISHQ